MSDTSAIIDHLVNVVNALAVNIAPIKRAIQVLRAARERKSLVMICGNGGSAANASHFACDLQSVGVRAIALDSVPTLTARGNDNGYHDAFAAQLRALQEPGSVLVVLSCSGTSENVLAALRNRDEQGDAIAIFGGFTGAAATARSAGALLIAVPSTDYEVIEDVQSAIGHAIKKALRE